MWDAWDLTSEEHKRTFDHPELYDFVDKEVMKKKGVKIVKAEPAGFRSLVERFDKIQRASVIAASKKFGVRNPGAIIDAYKRNRAKWAKLTEGIGNDTAKLEKLIWEHIYSKIDPDKL